MARSYFDNNAFNQNCSRENDHSVLLSLHIEQLGHDAASLRFYPSEPGFDMQVFWESMEDYFSAPE